MTEGVALVGRTLFLVRREDKRERVRQKAHPPGTIVDFGGNYLILFLISSVSFSNPGLPRRANIFFL